MGHDESGTKMVEMPGFRAEARQKTQGTALAMGVKGGLCMEVHMTMAGKILVKSNLVKAALRGRRRSL